MLPDLEQGRYRDEETVELPAPASPPPTLPREPPDHANGTAAAPDTIDAKWKSPSFYRPGWLGQLRPETVSFSATCRWIFNYPEPRIKLRSTAWLDGLRGLAAFEVFVFHYCDGWITNRLSWGPEPTATASPSWWLFPFLRTFYASGDAAVCLFFIISGYVLSHRMLTLLRQDKRDEFYPALASAVFRRPFRLYLPVAIETLVLMLACRLLGLPKPAAYEPAPSLLLEFKHWWVALVHLFMPLRWPALWQDVLNPYDGTISWTIPLEFFGSLVTYLVLLAISRISRMRVRQTVLAIIIVHAFVKDDWVSATFILGMTFADWELHNDERAGDTPSRAWRHVRRFLFPALFLLGFFLAGIPAAHFSEGSEDGYRIETRWFYDWIGQPLAYFGLYRDRQVDRYILAIAGMCSAVAVCHTPVLKWVVTTRPVQYLGKISFGLYLCHIFMRAWLRPLNSFYLGAVGLALDDLDEGHRQASVRLFGAYCLYMLVSTPLNLIMAGLFERFLDSPSVRNAKRLENWALSVSSRPTPASDLPTTQQETGIAMVDLNRTRRVAGTARPPAEAERPLLAPPTEFEEEVEGEAPPHSLPAPSNFEDEAPIEELEPKESDSLI